MQRTDDSLLRAHTHFRIQDPLQYADTVVAPQRRRLTEVGGGPDAKGIIGFIGTIFGNGGKLSQLGKDTKFRELTGLAFATAFTAAGFIMSFFSSSGPDPNTELLKSINQTVTATYEVVLQIQDELHQIANELVSIQNQITAVFNALNTAILTTQCITAFGTFHGLLSRHPSQAHLQSSQFPLPTTYDRLRAVKPPENPKSVPHVLRSEPE